MENATKAIIIAASVVITLAIVTIGFLILRTGQSTANDALNNMGDMANKVAESEYTMYDGMVVTGSEVLSAIDKVAGSGDLVGVQVYTGFGASHIEHWFVNDATDPNDINQDDLTTIAEAEDINDPDNYINPAGRFEGKVARDQNGRIASISFEQQ